MAVPVTVTFYRIQRCGHYKGHDKMPALGGVTRTLLDISHWARGLKLEQTKTYTPAEGGSLPVYLADVGQSGKTWLITLWNETHGVDEKVPSLMANAGVGQAAVILNEPKAGSIPGFATYFWFIPDLEVFATLRFARPFTGQTGLQSYISSFLEYFSSFCVREADAEGDIRVIGYRDGADDDVQQLYPRFRARIFTKPGNHDYVLNNAEGVRRIVKKDVLQLAAREDLSLWQKTLALTGVTPKKTRKIDSARLECSIDVELDRAGVEAIIDEWEKSGGADSGADYGFLMRGGQKEYWLAKSLARDQFLLDLDGADPELIDKDLLLDQLTKQYASITAILR